MPRPSWRRTYAELIERAGIDAAEVEDVVAGCVQQFGEQAINIGRNAWLEAGLPIETPATTVDRQCGSAQQAINFAAALVASGVHDVAIGGGVEHMGHISFADSFEVQKEHGFAFSPELMKLYDLVPQGISAEMIADKWEIPRSELDEIGLRSHQLAAKATEEGRFDREIVPFQVNGDTYTVDQGIRPDTSLEKLSQLKPAFKEDGKVTAGNSSQVSDGAAAVLLMTRDKAAALGLTPRARIVDQTTVGSRPGDHAHRADPGDPEVARAQRDDHRRHRPDRDQRGVRLGGRGLAPRARPRHGAGQRQRRRDRAWTSARLDRCPADDHAAARAGADRQGNRPGDDVLRRRARHGHAHPTGLSGVSRCAAALSVGRARSTRLSVGIVLLMVAGCGGDEPQTFPPGVAQPIAKVEFLAEADRICGATNDRVEAAADGLVATGRQPPRREVRRVVLGVVVPALEAEVRAIRALGAPSGDAPQVEAIIAATERGIAEVRADPVAVLDGPPPALREAGRLARAYGSRHCGVPAA